MWDTAGIVPGIVRDLPLDLQFCAGAPFAFLEKLDVSVHGIPVNLKS